MLAPTTFFFKKSAGTTAAIQRDITRVDVETPASSPPTNIVALYQLEDDNTNSDPNALAIYGTWTATSRAYLTHVGVLNDNGFSRYLSSSGLQINGWAAGAADTYFNADGVTFSWIARVTPAVNARLLQFWQADLEYIDVYFSSLTEITISVILGTGTTQTAVADISSLTIDDGTFHHYTVTFNPLTERIARLYINGVVVATTSAVAGAVMFGDTAVDIRRGISFGSSYTDPDVQVSGDVDHATILKGVFEPSDPIGDNLMLEATIFMRYFTQQMVYNPGIALLTIGAGQFLTTGPGEFLTI